jgi:hypothetical protein
LANRLTSVRRSVISDGLVELPLYMTLDICGEIVGERSHRAYLLVVIVELRQP